MTDKTMIQIANEVVEAKDEMLDYVEAWKTDLANASAQKLAEDLARQASKNSAIQKLTALGLTEQEVYDLLGITPDESTEPQE
jgi:hypothetical protein